MDPFQGLWTGGSHVALLSVQYHCASDIEGEEMALICTDS